MGRPKGAENKDKPWRNALRKAVHELRAADGDDKKVKALGLLADRLVTKGLEGDIAAIKEIGDRYTVLSRIEGSNPSPTAILKPLL